MRRGVSNFFDNLTYPIVIVNQFLQGKVGQGFSDIGRFAINSTLGVGGLLDPATDAHLEPHNEDFGQTFGKWGIKPGPYLVLPFLGPSTFRDGAGSLCAAPMYAWRYADEEWMRYGMTGLYGLDTRARLLEAEELISGDRYSFVRDAYLQRREYLIKDGQVEDEFMNDSSSDDDTSQKSP
jgi:phospholipid-binding lipoprotein MlaA